MALDQKSATIDLPPKLLKVVTVIAVAYCIFELAYAIGLLRTEAMHMYPGTFRSLVLLIILVLVFITLPARGGSPRVKIPWYDYLFMAASIPGTIYMSWAYIDLIPSHGAMAEPIEQVLGVITVVVVLEAVRRTVGWIVSFIALVFIFYALFGGSYLVGPLHVEPIPFDVLIAEIFLFPNGMFGFILNIIVIMIFTFILFGALLQVSGGAVTLTDLATALAGRYRGGPAKVAVVSSGFMGMMSGSAVANVAVNGPITIPMMKRVGFSGEYASAIEAVASAGGQIMPPVMGTVAFVMADYLKIPYAKICLAAALPGFLYYLALFVMIDFQAARKGLRGVPREQLPRIKDVILKGWPFILPIPALVYFLTNRTEVTACLYTIVVLCLGSMFKKETRLTPNKILAAFILTTKTMITIVPVVAGVGIILSCLSITGLGLNLSSGLVELAHGYLLPLLILGAATSLIMGMGVTATVCYILLATTIAPALTKMGVPVLAAHLFILYWGMLFVITPPFALAVYVASGIGGTSMMKTGYVAMRLAIIAYIVPFMWVYQPELLLQGPILNVAISAALSIVGVFALGGALEGYLLTRAGIVQRIMLAFAGICLIYPEMLSSIAGGTLLGAVLLWQWTGRKVAGRKTDYSAFRIGQEPE